jgi:L-arginine dehydrogenase
VKEDQIMQPIVVDAKLAAQVVEQIDVLGAMRALFAGLHAGKVTQPPQTLALLPDGGGGDFIAYLAALADPPVFGAKLSPYLPRPGGGIVTAWTLLMSSETGAPLLLCDSLALTRERTAATTALAVDLLAPRTATRLALIGCGAVGRAHLRHVLPLRDWQQIMVWSPHASDRAADIRAAAASATIAGSLREAVEDAEVVMLCTSAAAAVVDPAELPHCRLLTSISTNAPRAHEIPPARLAELDVYCDARGNAPLAAGEMLIAREGGWDPASIRGDLAELVAAQAPLPERTAFFRSIGLGCEDIALAAAIHRHLSEPSAVTGPG